MDEFEKIYSDYYDLVYRYVISLCKDEIWAQDLTQECFFKALKNIKSFRGDCKLSVWLCQIAKNTFLTQAKRKAKYVDYPIEVVADKEDTGYKVCCKEVALQAHQLLHQLDEPYKEVFWMRTFGELSFADIACIYNKTESWARVTYYRARLKIKEGLR